MSTTLISLAFLLALVVLALLVLAGRRRRGRETDPDTHDS
jgi:uncharacterized protein (TIGR03382 family)